MEKDVARLGSLLAAMNTASEYGFGAVIAALPGFLVKLSIDSGWVQKNFKRNGKRDWLADLGIW